MLEDGKITAHEATQAKAQPIRLNVQHDPNSVAPYFVEEIRRYLEGKYGTDQVHEGGLRVYTTLDTGLQKTANTSIRDGLATYERRHGWKGKLRNVLAEGATLDKFEHPDWDEEPAVGDYIHALVTQVGSSAAVKFGLYRSNLTQSDAAWTQKKLASILRPGDICYIKILVTSRSLHSIQITLPVFRLNRIRARRVRFWLSTMQPVRSKRWWVGATSMNRSSIVRHKR
jgi:penicillin-binding protein 1A